MVTKVIGDWNEPLAAQIVDFFMLKHVAGTANPIGGAGSTQFLLHANTEYSQHVIIIPRTGTITIGSYAFYQTDTEVTQDLHYVLGDDGDPVGSFDGDNTAHDITPPTANRLHKLEGFTNISVTAGQILKVKFVNQDAIDLHLWGVYIEYT